MLEEGVVLDALGTSPRVPLTTKRMLARVSRATSRVVGVVDGHLKSNDLWVHDQDCTIANAMWLTRLVAGNRDLRIRVYRDAGAEADGSDAPPLVGYLGAVYAFGIDPSPIVYTSGEEGTGLDPTVAFFLGHVLASLPKNNVSIGITNGKQFNLSRIMKAEHVARLLGPSAHRPPILEPADWRYMEGALYRNALNKIERASSFTDVVPNRLNFNNMQLTDDSMLHIGAKLHTPQVSEWAHHMCFCNNRFGKLGTAAIFSGSPCQLIRDAHPFKYLALKALQFEQTPMSEGVPYIVNAIVKGCMPNLVSLSLVQVNLESTSAYQIFSLLGTSHVPNLRCLNVSQNPFTGFALHPLTLDAWKCPGLVMLRARNLDNLLQKDHAILARAILDGKLPNVKMVHTKAPCVHLAALAQRKAREAMSLIVDAESPPSKKRKKPNPFDDGGGETSSEQEEEEEGEEEGESGDSGDSGESQESEEF